MKADQLQEKNQYSSDREGSSSCPLEVDRQEDLAEPMDHHLSASVRHRQADKHHHHRHAAESHHVDGHHLLQIEDMSIGFMMYDPDEASFLKAQKKEVSVIENLSLAVHAGEILALVGASGSGKTLLADAIMGLFEPNAIVRGRIWFDGELQDADSLARLRGRKISLVPQGVNYLDPLMKVGKQVRGFGKNRLPHAERTSIQQALFKRYDLDPLVADQYPFELSGGMARRVLLASALLDDPQLIVADEPTPGLDLELAVKALEDFRALADEGKGVLLITHDIELALKVADRVAVFKEGTIVEETAVENFASPDLLDHPFSRALWHALPEHDFRTQKEIPHKNIRQNETQEGVLADGDMQSEGIQQGRSKDKKEEPLC